MDKELALVIAEMLIKQDETTAQLKETNNMIKETNNMLVETNNILKEFMGISVKQWEQQHIFNEIIAGELKEIKNTLVSLVQLDTRVKAIEERESKFESRLSHIEKLLKAS